MECSMGPSDKWPYTEQIAIRENLITSMWDVDRDLQLPHKVATYHIIRKWIEWAYANGDPTVWEYAEEFGEDRQLPTKTVHYHNSDHKHEDFAQWIPPEDDCGEWLTKEGEVHEQPDHNGLGNAEATAGDTGGDDSVSSRSAGDPGSGGDDHPLIEIV